MTFDTAIPLLRLFAGLVGRVPGAHLLYLARQLRKEKPHLFGGQLRINSFFPPFPSLAFGRFRSAMIARRRVPYSTYVAVTGQCPYRCAHCSYARRGPGELSREKMLEVIREVKALGTATLGLTGGEPLLREDLEEMVAAAGPEMATILFTTGHGLDRARAARLARAGLGCVTIGIEEAEAAAHDRTRRERGSFAEAAAAMVACREAGLYAALSTVGTREKLASGGLERVYSLAKDWGARELRILPPAATGGWAGCEGVMLTPEDRAALAQFHAAHNRRRAGPAVAAVGWLESEAMFGCGAGYHHLFIDAAGEVCPCDLAPLSFGSVADEPLARIWDRMAARFPVPRTRCVARSVAAKLVGETLPLARGKSEAITAPPGEDDKLPEVYRRLLGHKKR